MIATECPEGCGSWGYDILERCCRCTAPMTDEVRAKWEADEAPNSTSSNKAPHNLSSTNNYEATSSSHDYKACSSYYKAAN